MPLCILSTLLLLLAVAILISGQLPLPGTGNPPQVVEGLPARVLAGFLVAPVIVTIVIMFLMMLALGPPKDRSEAFIASCFEIGISFGSTAVAVALVYVIGKRCAVIPTRPEDADGPGEAGGRG